MDYAQVRQGIHHRVNNCRYGCYRGGFAHPLGPQGIVRAGGLHPFQSEIRELMGLGHGVVHEAPAYQLAIAVEHPLFQQGCSYTLGQTPVNLSFDYHGVDYGAAVVDIKVVS